MKLFISREKIKNRVTDLAKEISEYYKDKDNFLILGVLKGSFMFLSDLVKEIDIDNMQIEFISISSYEGIKSGKIKGEQINGKIFNNKHVLIIEDIVDTGKTMSYLLNKVNKGNPASIEIVSFLFKPEYYKLDYRVRWNGFDIHDEFVVGMDLIIKSNLEI